MFKSIKAFFKSVTASELEECYKLLDVAREANMKLTCDNFRLFERVESLRKSIDQTLARVTSYREAKDQEIKELREKLELTQRNFADLLVAADREITIANPTFTDKEIEPTFTLKATDVIAPYAVRCWASAAISYSVNETKVKNALRIADEMEAWPIKKLPD